MKITIEPTLECFYAGTVTVREWQGVAEGGREVSALVCAVRFKGLPEEAIAHLVQRTPDTVDGEPWPEAIMARSNALELGIEVKDIVQIRPDSPHVPDGFGGCLVTVTEVHPWGVMGYVKNAGAEDVTYVKVFARELTKTGGKAHWRKISDD